MDAGFPYLVAAYVLVFMVLFAYMIFLDIRQRRLRGELKKLERAMPHDQFEETE